METTSPLLIHVTEGQLREHDLRLRRSWRLVLVVSFVVFVGDLVIQCGLVDVGGPHIPRIEIDTLPFVVELAILLCVAVGQFAGGTGVVVAARSLLSIRRRLRSPYDDLELSLDRGAITTLRGPTVVHRDASLLRVTAFPEWLMMTILEAGRQTSFAVPADAEQRRRLLESLGREPSIEIERRGSFLASFFGTLVLRTSEAVVVEFVTKVLAVVVVATLFAAPLLAWLYAGPVAAAIATASLALAAVALLLVRRRRRDRDQRRSDEAG